MDNLNPNEQQNSQQQPQQQLPPDSHMAWAIVSTLLCCWPFGIPAIVNAAKVDKLWFSGYHQAALEASRKAKMWANISAIIGILIVVCYLLMVFISALNAPSTTPTTYY